MKDSNSSPPFDLLSCVTNVLTDYKTKVQNDILGNICIHPREQSNEDHDRCSGTPLDSSHRHPSLVDDVSAIQTPCSAKTIQNISSPPPTLRPKTQSAVSPFVRTASTASKRSTNTLIQNYSSVLFADEPQMFALVFLNKNIPYDHFIGFLGKEPLRLICTKQTLLATVPPLNPGRSFLTLQLGSTVESTMGPASPMIQFIMTCFNTEIPLDSLPVTVVRPPQPLAAPRLAYTIDPKQRLHHTHHNVQRTSISNTKQDTGKKNGHLPNHHSHKSPTHRCTLTSLRAGQGEAETKKKTLWTRLRRLQGDNCDNCAHSALKTIKELQLALASLDTNLINSTIPLMLRASIFHSVPQINRKIIYLYHHHIFEIQPFQIYSTHIFTKGKASESYSVFCFSLRKQMTHNKCYQQEVKDMASCQHDNCPSYIASLERFEANDRMCSDPRYWRLIDEAVPCKNMAASKLHKHPLDLRISPYFPSHLNTKHSSGRTPLKTDQMIQLAEDVFIHWELWPQNILPDEHCMENHIQHTTRDEAVQTSFLRFSPDEKNNPLTFKDVPSSSLDAVHRSVTSPAETKNLDGPTHSNNCSVTPSTHQDNRFVAPLKSAKTLPAALTNITQEPLDSHPPSFQKITPNKLHPLSNTDEKSPDALAVRDTHRPASMRKTWMAQHTPTTVQSLLPPTKTIAS